MQHTGSCRWQLAWVAITTLMMAASFISPPYPAELILQHIPTGIGLALLTVAIFFWKPSSLSVGCLLAFLWLHLIGARWIYSMVPYDDWTRWLTGTALSETMNWERNHYDRLVHFASGVLFVFPASEMLQRSAGMRPRAAAMVAISIVLAIGAVYEIAEWQLAVTLSPSQAEAYNGQQGDVWDPQKDMALAWLGSLIAAGLAWRWRPTDPSEPTNTR